MSSLQIGHHSIGRNEPTFVIAEIGVNHDGSVSRALELVQHARRGGANAIKLQLFEAGRLVHRDTPTAGYQAANCGATDQTELLRKYELSVDDVERVIDASRVAGVTPIATPFSREDVFVIEQLGLPAIKIASPDLVNKPLLERCAASKRPMLISTGAATIEEIELCVEWLNAWKCEFALLHCVSSYPTPPADAQLGWIDDLRRRFDVPIGYSDHTTEVFAGALAVAGGACVIEKHLTWSRFAEGPDHAASADPHQFELYVKAIRSAEVLRGNGSRQVLPIEQDVRRLSRQSLVVAQPIAAGEKIEMNRLTVQRPGTGILARDIDAVAGRIARQHLPAGTILKWDMLIDAA